MDPMTENRVLFALALLALVVSGIAPTDRATWLLEVLPVIVAGPVLAGTHRRFPLTSLAYRLIFIHALILILGGHYTYAQVPLGDWARDAFGLARNHYDRLGHLAQGFIPAIVVREVFLRLTPLRPGGWTFVIVSAVCLGISAFYELIEWWVAVAAGQAADAFLGTQGDPWDTQWDMFLALVGAVAAQIMFGRAHDRALAGLRP
jgi:putative membrane protein